MRSFVRNYIQAEKARREESGEAGFSLIELIVVVVILGILAAVAIPVFLNIQGQAKDSAVESITANAASQAAAAFAQDKTVAQASDFSNLTANTDPAVTLTLTGTDVDTVCVAGYGGGSTKYAASATAFKAGPGC